MGKRLLLFVMVLSLAAGGCRAQAESENEKESISQARIERQIFISFNGEIQGFEADSAGLLQNIEQLAYLAPRGGLGMEEEAENVQGDSNPYLSESGSTGDMEEILTSESGLTWIRISGRSGADSGSGTSVPERGDIAAYVQEEDLYIAEETGEKDVWNIWKLPGYGEWMEQEIRIFLRVMTGMEVSVQTQGMDEFIFFDEYSGFLDEVENIEAIMGWEQDDSRDDYDGDKVTDRIYVENMEGEDGEANIRYGIYFGNGTMLETEAEEGRGIVPHFCGKDIDGDGTKEIIYLQTAKYGTTPEAFSEIYFYQKDGLEYRKMASPGDGCRKKVNRGAAGYPVVIKAMNGNKICFGQEESGLECETEIQDEKISSELTLLELCRQYMENQESAAEQAWGYKVEAYQGKPSVLLYEKILGRYTGNSIVIRTIYEDGRWNAIEMYSDKTGI